MNTIYEFRGKSGYLSNFYPSHFTYGGVEWPTVEHAYQAMKIWDGDQVLLRRFYSSLHSFPAVVLMPEVLDLRRVWLKFAQLESAGVAKRKGRQAPLQPDWDRKRVPYMTELVHAKFFANSAIRRWLINTEDAILEEGNTWGDRFWGVCPPRSGIGENHLGKILMAERQTLQLAA